VRSFSIGFHWNGAELVVPTVSYAPKVKALLANPKVAVTIDTAEPPWHILLVRGTASVEIVDGVVPEFLAASRQGTPEEEDQQVQGRLVRPVGIFDHDHPWLPGRSSSSRSAANSSSRGRAAATSTASRPPACLATSCSGPRARGVSSGSQAPSRNGPPPRAARRTA
jgi:hypothetical protein